MLIEGWGAGSTGKALPFQACGPKCDLQNPHKKMSMTFFSCNLSDGEAETWKSMGLDIQLA